jgi:single-stranded DNA-binding protein
MPCHPASARTSWHDCIVWNPITRTAVQGIYMARKGDQVQVSGYFETSSFKTSEGQAVTSRRFVVDAFNFLKLRKPPEIA